MRYTVLLWGMLICGEGIGHAQKPFEKKWMPGFYAGINWANQQIRGSDVPFTPNPGLRAGVLLEKPITHRLTITTDLAYHQMGSKNTYFSFERENLDYLHFSLKANEYLPIGGTEMFFAAGAYTAFGLGGERINADGSMISENVFDDPAYRTFEWGLALEMGLRLRQGSFVKGGFHTAFNNVYEMQQIRYFNYAFSISAGHQFGWGSFRRSRP